MRVWGVAAGVMLVIAVTGLIGWGCGRQGLDLTPPAGMGHGSVQGLGEQRHPEAGSSPGAAIGEVQSIRAIAESEVVRPLTDEGRFSQRGAGPKPVTLEVIATRHQSRSAEAIAGRRIEFERIGPGGERETVGEGTTGADGRLQLERHLDLGLDFGPAVLRARVFEPGYTERWSRLRTQDEGRTYAGRVTVQRGTTVRGRVVDLRGGPAGGDVYATRLESVRGKTRWSYHGKARVQADGSFALHVPTSGFLRGDRGPGPVLVARSKGQGTATLRGGDLADRESVQEVLLTVAGEGRLHGRVVDAQGRPVPGVHLTCVSEEWEGALVEREGVAARILDRRPDPARFYAGAALSAKSAGVGFDRETTVTRVDGTFDLEAPRASRFRIFAEDDVGSGRGGSPAPEGRIWLTPKPVRAGTATEPMVPLELRLARRQVVVTLTQSNGAPWVGSVMFAKSAHEHGPSGCWSEWPSITVRELPSGRLRFGRAIGDAEFAFAITGTSTLEVVVMGGKIGGEGFPVCVRTIDAEPGGGDGRPGIQSRGPMRRWPARAGRVGDQAERPPAINGARVQPPAVRRRPRGRC